MSVSAVFATIAVGQDWSEADLIERFQSVSPYVRDLKAKVSLAQAEVRTRTVYSNPSASYSREGAGYTEFFQAAQTLPLSGRLRFVREAGNAEIESAEGDRDAVLWSLRSDLRIAFYRMLAAQERIRLLTGGSIDIEQLIRVLRQRETEGEGSRYDRARAERELTELRTDAAGSQALVAAARGLLVGFLPEGTAVQSVRGRLSTAMDVPPLDILIGRALAARADYRAEQKTLTRYQLEEQAARRLRFPEPTVSAGLKRASVISGLPPNPFSDVTRSGLVFGISVPIPVFNRGQYEVARSQAEQERIEAHRLTLAREISAQVQRARDLLVLRQETLKTYQAELQSAGAELTRITQIAYQEGEIGILELLDALRVSRNAALRLLDLQADVAVALVELDRVVGEEVRP